MVELIPTLPSLVHSHTRKYLAMYTVSDVTLWQGTVRRGYGGATRSLAESTRARETEVAMALSAARCDSSLSLGFHKLKQQYSLRTG